MNRAITRLGGLLAILLTALLVNATCQQVLFAGDTENRPGNQRQVLNEYDRERGPILVGADPIARSIQTDDEYKYLRVYSQGQMFAPASGFYSLLYGASGVERAENRVLNGDSDLFFVDRIQQLFSGESPQGGGVTLTLNAAAQRAAYEGLSGKVGSVVALDPGTGAILALASSPSYDPNRLANHDLRSIQDYYEQLQADPAKPMLNRPLVSNPPPGSSFKLVTAAAALESGKYTPNTVIPGPAKYRLPGSSREVPNWNGKACGPNGKVTLAQALAISCNTAFAWLGNQLGQDALRSQAEKFGFDTSMAVPMRAATSRYPSDMDEAQTAMSAIGQFDVSATSLQMALVGAAVGNSGVVMNPYLVKEIRGPDMKIVQTTTPSQFGRALSAENASAEMSMMVGVVNSGTGSNARIPGIQVGGKTGTAETGDGRPATAWFVAVAPADSPRVAVAVAIEDAGGGEVSGNGLAAPIARAVIQAVLGGR